MHQDDLQFFKERGFGKKLGVGEKSCLIVVDAIVGFTDPTLPMGYEVSSQVNKINEIIQAARRVHMPVIFTVISYDEYTMEESNFWCSKMEGLRSLKAGTRAVEIDPRLDRKPGDDVIFKKYASAFFGTDLVSRLNSMNIDSLIVTGFTTSGCVRATVVDAIQYGYRPIVIEDAVGDRSADSHKQSLFDMDQKYADVISTQQLLTSLETQVSN